MLFSIFIIIYFEIQAVTKLRREGGVSTLDLEGHQNEELFED